MSNIVDFPEPTTPRQRRNTKLYEALDDCLRSHSDVTDSDAIHVLSRLAIEIANYSPEQGAIKPLELVFAAADLHTKTILDCFTRTTKDGRHD